MSRYSPFDKQLNDLEASDLQALTMATEGWYIEYKREVPNASSIAKSISAFANTYGGWLFYGVVEKSKENSVAGAFPGISRSEIDSALQCIRQATSSHVNPTPHYETKVFWGPCEAIGLTSNQAVICAEIPQSTTAPHVHKSGQIYRRVSDGSEPKPENDRFILDQLWQRSNRLRRDYKKWVQRKPEFSEPERGTPYVRLLLVTDLWRDKGAWVGADLGELRRLMETTTFRLGSIPFDNVYTSGNAIIGRQIRGNNPQNLGLTWRFYRDLVSEILVPLNCTHVQRHPQELHHHLEGYDHINRYIDILIRAGHQTPHVVDVNFLFRVLVGVVELQDNLMRAGNWTGNYYAKAQLLNAWRTIPFLDIPSVLDEFDSHGVPMCLNNCVTSPAGTAPETFVEIALPSSITDDQGRSFFSAHLLFEPIALALGIPSLFDTHTSEQHSELGVELYRAGLRAMSAQTIRNSKQL